MRKRLTSILLTLAMLVGLLPALSPQAEASTGVAIVDVYSLADIKSAANQDQVRIIRLMKDIDASKENVTYDGDGFNTNSAIGRLASGCVLNGNGHTIYNLRGPLFANNMGNIHDLNVTLVHSDENSDIFAPGGYPLLSGIASWNDYRGVGGVIENCTVTMNVKRDFGNVGGDWLSIDGISQGGTIRNCIAKLNIDLKLDSNAYGGISVRGIGFGYNNSLTDHCLVLGSVKITSPQSSNADAYFTGISDGTTQDSACALDTLSITAKSARNDPYEHFTLGSGSEGTGTRNRAASDMNVNYTFNNRLLLSGTPTTASGNYTLDTRPNILKDWDLSVLPDTEPTTTPDPEPEPKPTPEPEPTPTPEPEPTNPAAPSEPTEPLSKTVEFSYRASNNKTRQHYFYYSDLMFYNNAYRYQSELAKASLCLALSAFTSVENESWNNNLVQYDHRRAYNVEELYKNLGFTDDQYYYYDVALTDTSDKIAFSAAMKYITDGEGNTDTLVAVPLRGGGYGGEWGSNFNMTYIGAYGKNHVGFQRAADKVRLNLTPYLAQLKDAGKIKGNVKLWFTGYSRASATANILAHDVSALTSLGGVPISRENIYAYTFATPAGAKGKTESNDENIFNIISPVDMVPRVAPSAWGYVRYGTTLVLPTENNQKLIDTYQDLSGVEGKKGDLAIMPSQRALLDNLTDLLVSALHSPQSYYQSGIHDTIKNSIAKKFGAKPEQSDPTGLKTAISGLVDAVAVVDLSPVRSVVGQIAKEAANLERAHHPEIYLARLETENLQSEDDFASVRHNFRFLILYPPHDRQTNQTNTKNINAKIDFQNRRGQSVGSYANGVCNSGDVTVEMTNIGLIATFPADGDYTFTISGTDAAKVSVTFYAYEGGELEPTRDETFDRLPVSNDSSCTVFVPESSYDDFYAEDADGYVYYPGDDIDSIYTPETPVSMNFTDVPESAYFYEPVLWAVENGITSGTSATKFSPYEGCTRGQVVTFLWRAAGCPEPESSYNPFSDVPSNAYYHDAVLWAAEEGITTGTSRTRFEPNATVTRAQTVTFLWRWAGSPEPGSAGSFRDVSRSAYYADAVAWAVEYGITNGTAPGLFSPAQTCTRAQIVTFLYRDLAAEWEDYET